MTGFERGAVSVLCGCVLGALLVSAAVANSAAGEHTVIAHDAADDEAAAEPARSAGESGGAPQSAVKPSKLDYVVLASLADASSLLSLTAYRAATPTATPMAEVK